MTFQTYFVFSNRTLKVLPGKAESGNILDLAVGAGYALMRVVAIHAFSVTD
jgi:hypothetical protein